MKKIILLIILCLGIIVNLYAQEISQNERSSEKSRDKTVLLIKTDSKFREAFFEISEFSETELRQIIQTVRTKSPAPGVQHQYMDDFCGGTLYGGLLGMCLGLLYYAIDESIGLENALVGGALGGMLAGAISSL